LVQLAIVFKNNQKPLPVKEEVFDLKELNGETVNQFLLPH